MQKHYVIIIDDDPDDLTFFKEAFEDLNFDVPIKFFVNGLSAFDYLKSAKSYPFLIICDINMPGINGFEFRELIKTSEHKKLNAVPFIFLSTTASPTMYRYSGDLNIQGYFQKPGSYAELKILMSKILLYWNEAYEALNEAV